MTRAAVLVAAALVLAGCGYEHPGVAAVVGSQTITDQQLDTVAHALCSANRQGTGVSSLPSRGVRAGALSVLIRSELARQLGQARHVQPDARQVSAALAQDEQNLRSLPKVDYQPFRSALKGYAEGQLILLKVGKRSLEAQGHTNVTNNQALAEGSRILAAFEKKHPVTVDPRFGTYANGAVHFQSGSLSVAESARARAGAKADPSSTWSATLPAAQTCS